MNEQSKRICTGRGGKFAGGKGMKNGAAFGDAPGGD